MRDLGALAESMRVVREASRRFIELHAVEEALIHPGLDRVAADLFADTAAAGDGWGTSASSPHHRDHDNDADA